MAFDSYFEEEDEEGVGLLRQGGARPGCDKRGAPAPGGSGGGALLRLAAWIDRLPLQAKLALAASLLLLTWHVAWRTQPSTAPAQAEVAAAAAREKAPTPGPAAAAAASLGANARRGLKGDGDEVKWAEDAFGLYFSEAIPKLEGADHDLQGFLNLLSQGKCDEWSAGLAESGNFSFSLPHLQGAFKTRSEVRDAFCKDSPLTIAAARLIWHFPDMARRSGLALYEVFTRAANSGSKVEKQRWAHYAVVGPDLHLAELRVYAEQEGKRTLQAPMDAVVRANLRRLDGGGCDGFADALPAAGTESWILQSLPDSVGARDGLDESPREKILAKCRKDTEADWSNIDFQLATVEGVFPSPLDSVAFVFFHKEKRFKGTLDVTDDPEALIVKLDRSATSVHSLVFYHVEGVHLVQEWGWKYGSAAHSQ